MKIYFRNKAARLKLHNVVPTCKRCSFCGCAAGCPFYTSTNVDCCGKGHWIDGELSDIFKI